MVVKPVNDPSAQNGEKSAQQFDLRLDHGPDSVNLAVSGDSNSLLVTVTPPLVPIQNDGKRAPVDICAVIDVSGSMETAAPSPAGGEAGKPMEDTGLSVLDVVKHAMNTITATMQEDDRLAIVAFSNQAEVRAEFTKTTAEGKGQLTKAVADLRSDAATNLWDGLRTGMDLLVKLQENEPTSERLSALFILTDGQPNVEPPRGHIPMLKQYLESHPKVDFTISSFGFGYHLDSKLMADIAKVGGGGYGFIPDSGMVGTVFVHSVANLYTTYGTKAVLNIELPKGTILKRGAFPFVSTSWGAKLEIGDLQYGQTRDIVLEFEGTKIPELTASVTVKPWFSTEAITESQQFVPSPTPLRTTDAHRYHAFRYETVFKLMKTCKMNSMGGTSEASKSTLQKSHKVLSALKEHIEKRLPNYPNAVALAKDLEEVVLAVSDITNWKKWGVHYFPSLARAHQYQQCSNFKDAGLQIYGKDSLLFTKSRDTADTAFDKLPPPKPSRQARHGVARVQVSSMSRYNNRAGPCFTGDCEVTLTSGPKVRLDRLTRGMQVATPEGARSVGAIVKTVIKGGIVALCQIGELKVTPWHPVYLDGKWRFPQDVVAPQLMACESIYSILLEQDDLVDSHAFEVGGVRAVTLGHGLVEDAEDVRAHPFFGSYAKVVDSLKFLSGFESEDGVVACTGVKRGANGLICGFSREESGVTMGTFHENAVTVDA